MFHSRSSNRIDQIQSFAYPTTKLRNISCAFCRHEFFLRDIFHLKGAPLPLLLSCGHAACAQCGKNHISDLCPLCNTPSQSESCQDSALLPINIYVTGLIGISSARPVHGNESDISFSQSISSRTRENYNNIDPCCKCFGQAVIKCMQCDALFCHNCNDKVHSTVKLLQKHFYVLITETSEDSIFELKTCAEHNDLVDYYCQDCEVANCSKCICDFHQQHRVVKLRDKNEEYKEDFQKTRVKLSETLQRVRQTQKKLQRNRLFPEESQNSETVETAINQHFAHLHGVLQNVEKRMIDKLHKQRNDFMVNVADIQQRLKQQEDQLQSALRMAATTEEIFDRINLKEIIPELERLADVPCHLVEDPIVGDEKIEFYPDPSIIETLEDHCKIEVPKMPGYNLLPSQTVPVGYEAEPLDPLETTKLLSESFCETTLTKRASSCLSLCSTRRSEAPTLREGSTALVNVCYIENPSSFYVRRVSCRDEMKKLENRLNNYANHSNNIPDEVEINKLYAVKRPDKNKWYRGRVKSINSMDDAADTYKVFNVDYGNTDTNIRISQMRLIPKDLVSIPPKAIKCSLYDIVPADGIRWSGSAIRLMRKAVKHKYGSEDVPLHIVQIQGNEYLVDICKGPSSNGQGTQVSVRDSLIFLGHGSFVTSQYLRRTCPQSVRRYLREEMPTEAWYDVKFSHVESPDSIYVQKAGENLNFLNSLKADMANHYKYIKTKPSKGLIQVPEIGQPCAVEMFGGEWRRGTIVGIPASRIVDIFLVDYGSTITTAYDMIRKLNEKFMVSPTQAIKVTIADIKPREDVWCDEAMQLTKRLISGKFGRVFVYEKTKGVYAVALYVGFDEDCESLATILANNGLAEITGTRLSRQLEMSMNQSTLSNLNGKVRNARTFKTKKPRSPPKDTTTADPYKLLVKIVRVVSPDEIYVCDTSYEKEYGQMKIEMQKFYNKYKDVSNKCDWQVHCPCAIYSSRDRCFCRGEISAIKSADEVDVYLYDLALTETVKIPELQTLKKKFWATRAYVCKVKLAGILPCGGSSVWTLSSCEKLKDIIAENQNSKFYISKVASPDEDTLNVDLWVEEVKIDGPLSRARIEIASINRKLVENGYALPIKQYNEKKTTVLALELKRQISYIEEASKSDSVDWPTNGHFKQRKNKVVTGMESVDCNESVLTSNSGSESTLDETLNEATVSFGSIKSVEDSLVPIEPKINAWLPAENIYDDKFLAVATYVDHDCCIYLHSKRQSNYVLQFIESTLASEYANVNIETDDLEWEKGDPCVAQYHNDKKWYRAVVTRTLENDMIEVEFIDYGNVEECEIGTLTKRLTLTQIPRVSTKCVVHQLLPNTPTRKWRTNDLDRIHTVLVDKEFEVFVLKRDPDYLTVSVGLLTPVRCELISYLINALHVAALPNLDDSESTVDKSSDVIVEGYEENIENHQENIGNDEKYIENHPEKIEIDEKYIENVKEYANEKIDEEEKEAVKPEEGEIIRNGYEENKEIESSDFYELADLPAPNCREEILPPVGVCPPSIDNDTNLTYNADDAVISGTANFTLSADQIEITQLDAMDKLESASLPDSNSLKNGEMVTSTPFDDSLIQSAKSYKPLTLPKDVKVVKAETVLIGLKTKVLLHLLDNRKSQILTGFRSLYDKTMQEMQDCADEQPILKVFENDIPCCAKFSDNLWYRGKIDSLPETDEGEPMIARILFVDFGNYAFVPCDQLRAIKDKWLEAPALAFFGRLWGVVQDPSANTDAGQMRAREVWRTNERLPVYVKIEGRSRAFFDIEVYVDEECTKLVYQPLMDEGFLLRKKTKED